MLKFGIICGLLASIVWRTTPSACRQHKHAGNQSTHYASINVNQIMTQNIQNYMDTTARPCENFYQYACGNWYQQHIDQLDYGDTLSLLDFEINRKLEHLLHRIGDLAKSSNNNNNNGNNNSSTNSKTSINIDEIATTTENSYANNDDENSEDLNTDTYRKMRTYYRSCKKIKPYNLKKYLLLVQPDFINNWASLARNGGGGKGWNPEKFDWLMVIAKLRLYGLNGVLLREEVLPRWDESSSNSIYLDKPNLAETEPIGEGVVIELLLDIGQTKRVANEIAREVDEFEIQLHKLHAIEDDEGPKEMQLGYLEEYVTEVAWLDYLKHLKGPTTNLKTTIIIQNIPYMRALVKLLNTVQKETICNYIMLRFLLYLKQQGPAEISKQECIASLRRAMPLAMSYVIGKHFYKDSHQNDEIVQTIFKNLKQKFQETLERNRLELQKTVVNLMLEKIKEMRLQIGNSPRNATTEYYDAYYENVELDPNSFYVNQLSLLRLNVEKCHESLESSTFDNIALNDTFIMTDSLGSSSSPFYVKSKNLIVIPYSLLQMPVYHRHLRNIFKYSVLGFTLAHEMLHGFDSSGIDYDSVGNIMGPSEEIAANQLFMQGLRCMQNELATGSRSLNEKLADYEGLRLAYDTYFNDRNGKNSTETLRSRNVVQHESLPEFTEKQLFFISFAQFFCGKVNPNVGQTAYLEHALDELRVLQSLANFEEFSKAFNCERRSKMQTKQRCKLW